MILSLHLSCRVPESTLFMDIDVCACLHTLLFCLLACTRFSGKGNGLDVFNGYLMWWALMDCSLGNGHTHDQVESFFDTSFELDS